MFDVPPNDSHPTLKCHRIIAQNIINFIENKENNG
jgi:phospholipase/lecithinase/hemolysin